MYLLPTLNRPKQLEKCLKSIFETAPHSQGRILVDHKDPALEAYKAMQMPNMGWDYWFTNGVTMGEKVGEVYGRTTDFIGIINDDFEFVTPNWNEILVTKLNGKNFISTNDRKIRSFMKPSGVTVWSKPLLDHLGWNSFFPPGLQHLFIDDVWLQLGNATGSWRLAADVIVLHHHALDGEMEQDATFHKTYDDFFKGTSRDQSVFNLFMQHDFKTIVDKILKFQDYLPGEQQQPKVYSK